ncbi:a1-alpha2 repression [Physocladia obscura]|uniref:A1-alpha2 repression n=1 Tax=Physocladia obscura TaxID=109957 RepID=A0AAD5XIS9_9FUNG|nr:a1-alpha2 repression [Physocladia obscura]
MNIDQETAKRLLANGAIMLLMDFPVDLSFGIDLNEWQTGPRFKGLKLIPPGFHFIHYRSVIYVGQWNTSDEDITTESDLDPDHVARLKYNILEFEANLGAYPLIPHPQQPVPTFQKWLRLTNFINEQLVNKLLPNSKKVSSLVSSSRFSELDGTIQGINIKNNNNRFSERETTDSTAVQNIIEIKFSVIDLKHSFPENSAPEQRTKYWLDKSYLLKNLLKYTWKGDYKALLGELQFSFVLFLVGQVYDGLEQWKSIVKLLCTSKEALADTSLVSSLFFDFISCLYAQLEECPDDFFVDALSSSNFLREAIVDLVCNIRDPDTCDRVPNPQLEQKLSLFVNFVSERFKWDLEKAVHEKWAFDENEEGEFAPVIAEEI